MLENSLSTQYSELAELARTRHLEYPIENKEEFISQMTKSDSPVIFHGKAYEPIFATGLFPEFFFPITSESDLIHKALELIMSRGLIPCKSLQQ
ncbi:MAG: hypothetical protein IGS39_01880 [Calothrix sp. C42_A2020_038]|nr:hypothetical protein [Calothrix sp. C42_A2020_038]